MVYGVTLSDDVYIIFAFQSSDSNFHHSDASSLTVSFARQDFSAFAKKQKNVNKENFVFLQLRRSPPPHKTYDR